MRIVPMIGNLVVALALALPVAAEEPPGVTPAAHEEMSRGVGNIAAQIHGMGERWRGHFRRPDGARQRPLISLALRYRQELGLSPAQVETLERIRDDFRREAIKRDADIRVAKLDLGSLVRTDPADVGKPVDMGKVEATVRDLERLRTEQQLARIRTIEQGKAQLTPEQRAKLGTLLAESSQRHWQRSGAGCNPAEVLGSAANSRREPLR